MGRNSVNFERVEGNAIQQLNVEGCFDVQELRLEKVDKCAFFAASGFKECLRIHLSYGF